jgi:hypothetical protein
VAETVTHVDIIDRLARVEEKIDTLVSKAIDNKGSLEDHDVRIRGLENSRSRFMGIGAGVAALAGVIGGKVSGILP